MATERQLEEAVARCVAIMVFYHNETVSRQSKAAMKEEVKAAAALVSGLRPGAADVVGLVEPELVARYGPETGLVLFREFRRAFEKAPRPDPILSPVKV